VTIREEDWGSRKIPKSSKYKRNNHNAKILHRYVMSTPTNNKEKVQCSCNPGFEGNPYLSGICQGKLLVTFPTL
jgi:hypothetical protein